MKIIVSGSRGISDYKLVESTLDNFIESKDKSSIEFVLGGARGVDSLAEQFAKTNNYRVKIIPANWNKFGKSAGYRRNLELIEYCNDTHDKVLIAIWDGRSPGTHHMIDQCYKNGFYVKVITQEDN